MSRIKQSVEHLSEDEIRQLLREKLHRTRTGRLERFRKTGRTIILVPETESTSFAQYRTEQFDEPARSNLESRQRGHLSQRILLCFEASILLLFIVVFSSAYGQLRTLNQKAVAAWDLPALSPTPLIRAIVLPSGHKPPTYPGGTRPNDSEIPEHLRPLAQSLAQIPVMTPTPGPVHGVRIQIPAIGVDAPIVQGDGWEQLKRGVAQRLGTANPGEDGNMVLSGHNDVFGEVFRDLDRLRPGDEIVIFTAQRSYQYIVTGWTLVEPTQVDVMDPTPNPTLTLISCYPYLVDTERIIVKAVLS